MSLFGDVVDVGVCVGFAARAIDDRQARNGMMKFSNGHSRCDAALGALPSFFSAKQTFLHRVLAHQLFSHTSVDASTCADNNPCAEHEGVRDVGPKAYVVLPSVEGGIFLNHTDSRKL